MTARWGSPVRRGGLSPVILALTAAAGLYAFWLTHTPLGVGWYRDDGVYVVTAKAMDGARGSITSRARPA